jgi:hypothetical protein
MNINSYNEYRFIIEPGVKPFFVEGPGVVLLRAYGNGKGDEEIKD